MLSLRKLLRQKAIRFFPLNKEYAYIMSNEIKAKKIPEYLNEAVIYQIFLRAFTPEGTLKSAKKCSRT